MHVRAVLPSYPPLSLVGSWITTHEFLRDLAAHGHDVRVTAYGTKGNVRQVIRHDGVTVERHFGAVTQPDVVVGHAGDDGSAKAIADRYEVPLVAMVHGGAPGAVRERLEGAALAVFNSNTFAERVAWSGNQIVAHPPIDLAAYKTATIGERVTLVNLAEDKGSELFWQLAEAMPELQFLGVMGGYGRQMLFSAPNVLMQRMTVDMAGKVYGRTRLLLMPSRHETWGRVGLEAGISGIPTVAHPLAGITEALGDAATYVEGGLDAWRDAVRSALEPAEWKRLSVRARRHAERYDSEAQLVRFREAVEDLGASCRLSA